MFWDSSKVFCCLKQIYYSTRNCICTKLNITTIPSVLDITAGYRILIYVFVQHIHWIVRRWGVSLLYHHNCLLYHRRVIISMYVSFWNKKPNRVLAVVSVLVQCTYYTLTLYSLQFKNASLTLDSLTCALIINRLCLSLQTRVPTVLIPRYNILYFSFIN